ncbi:sulfurtransferase, partial [Candidatus Poribacteria bacterium]|nr:sulfurtransferase [Candidatus Poribacteria bacterium]
MKRRAHAMFACLLALMAFRAAGVELPSRVVDTEWLDANADGDLVVVDIRDAITAYWESHIPGAVYLNAEAMRFAEDGIPVMLASAEMLARKLGALGIDRDTPVVVYTETGDYKAPYLVWILDYLGHTASAALEGGFGKWQAEGRFVTQEYPILKPTSYDLPDSLNDAVRSSLEDVEQILADGDYGLVDVRNPALYTGERGFWKRNGHIPGFKGHFWGDDLNADGTWRDVDELREAYAAIGVTADRPT